MALKKNLIYFNIHAHNFISGYVIVQHHPKFTYTHQKPQADLKNERNPPKPQPVTAKATLE